MTTESELSVGDWLMFRTNGRLKKGVVTRIEKHLIFVGTKPDDPAPIPITEREVERLVSERDEEFDHIVECTTDDCTFVAQTKYAREAHKIAVGHDNACDGTALMRHFASSEEATKRYQELNRNE